MRIAYVAAGAGAMYCGACARAVTLVRELGRMGHDVCIIPLYTPLKSDTPIAVTTTPIFLGGINVFLQQTGGWANRLPRFVAELLDRPRLLSAVSSLAVETDPRKLGPMTVSVLAGADGRQRQEVDRLLDYLAGELRPEVVHLTNSLLSGLAPALKSRLNVPVICSLQGEEHFVASLPQPHRDRAIALLRSNARSIDRFICCAQERRSPLADLLQVDAGRIRVIPTGLDATPFTWTGPRVREPFTVGYLSAICPGKGLDLLVDAVTRLVRAQSRDVRLAVAGRVLDKNYWHAVRQAIAKGRLGDRVRVDGELSLPDKVAFLKRCSVFVMPSRVAESRALAAMEAMATGVPVIGPDSGVFPELVARTGGGALFARDDADALAGALGHWMDDPAEADAAGRRAAEGIRTWYTPGRMAIETVRVYEGAGLQVFP